MTPEEYEEYRNLYEQQIRESELHECLQSEDCHCVLGELIPDGCGFSAAACWPSTMEKVKGGKFRVKVKVSDEKNNS